MPLQQTSCQAQPLATSYSAPSATHQPELLLLSWMIATLNTIVTDIQNHPLVSDPSPILLLSPTNKPTGSTYNFATLFATWEPSIPTYAKAFASSSFYLARQDHQAVTEWTHQHGSHLQPPTTSSPHHL